MNSPVGPAEPNDVATAWLAAMRAGDWEAAWCQTDRVELPRRAAQRRPGFVRQPGQLVWDGTPFAGRSVLVRCEHGLGDTLQFIRFVPSIAGQSRELHVMAQPHLLPLLQGAPGLGQVHDGWAGPNWPAHEMEIEVMELAYALRVTPDTLPLPYPHLAAQPAVRRAAPLQQLAAAWPHRDARLRVGLLWAASDWDPTRSIPLQAFAPVLRTGGVQFFGLQQGPSTAEVQAGSWPVAPLWQHTQSVEAAAAAMLALDLIVCVDGMPAHLAGTLGRPVWLLLKHDADWRWMDGRTDTPWYPQMRLFRQPAPGDWDTPLTQVAQALQGLKTG